MAMHLPHRLRESRIGQPAQQPPGTELEALIGRFFADPRVAYLHVHMPAASIAREAYRAAPGAAQSAVRL
jgi:hypothetical protein